MIDRDQSPVESGGRDPSGAIVRTRYDWSSSTPSTAAIEVVAAATGRDPMTINPPLHEHVDPDALDALVSPTGPNPATENVSVSFVFADLLVTVRRDGEVIVRADEPRE